MLSHVVYRINLRLKSIFGDQYEAFKVALELSNAIISGSFILQCLLNEHWRYSDIDIFIHYDGDCLETPIGKFLQQYQYMGYCNDYYTYMDVTQSFNYKVFHECDAQLINVNEPVKTYITRFDFDILKNYFEGNDHLVLSDYIYNGIYKYFALQQFLIHDLVNIIATNMDMLKVIDLSGLKITNNIINRYRKYNWRGFTFIGMPISIEPIYHIEPVDLKRQCIYYAQCDHCIYTYICGPHKHVYRAYHEEDFTCRIDETPDIISYILL